MESTVTCLRRDATRDVRNDCYGQKGLKKERDFFPFVHDAQISRKNAL